MKSGRVVPCFACYTPYRDEKRTESFELLPIWLEIHVTLPTAMKSGLKDQ